MAENGSDPEHGSKWSLEQAVVSFGEVRRFNLKRIQGAEGGSSADKRALDADPAHSFHVRDGDVVHMFGDCQDSFLHSVSKGQGVCPGVHRVRVLRGMWCACAVVGMSCDVSLLFFALCFNVCALLWLHAQHALG